MMRSLLRQTAPKQFARFSAAPMTNNAGNRFRFGGNSALAHVGRPYSTDVDKLEAEAQQKEEEDGKQRQRRLFFTFWKACVAAGGSVGFVGGAVAGSKDRGSVLESVERGMRGALCCAIAGAIHGACFPIGIASGLSTAFLVIAKDVADCYVSISCCRKK